MTDFILSNVDRHFNNVGVLRDAESLQFLRMAPIFDSGKSLFVSEPIPAQEELRKIKTASFAGTELGLLKYVKDRSIVDAEMCIRDRMKTTAEETQELLKIALAPAAYTQDIVEYIKAISNEWTEHFETYSQTEYIRCV